MSIYSANRMGMTSSAAITANESYKSNDLGRIIYESQVNDMTFFESIIVSDLMEANAIKEGTLLESEIKSLNEASVKEFFTKMKERIKAFWRKIEGVFRDIKNKIAAYILRDGKAFAEEFEKTWKKLDDSAAKKSWENIKVKKSFDDTKIMSNYKNFCTAESIKKFINDEDKSNKDYDSSSIKRKLFGRMVDEQEVSPKSFTDTFVKKYFKEETLSLSDLCDILKRGKDYIKELTRLEKETDKILASVEKELIKAERESNNDSEKQSIIIKNISIIVNVIESVSATVIKNVIGGIKGSIKAAKTGLKKALKYAKEGKSQSEVTNESFSFYNEADAEEDTETEVEVNDEVELATDPDTATDVEELDPEVKDEVKEVIEDAEAEVEEEV